MPDRLVTIGSYSTPFEASLVRAKLEAFDIGVILADENAVRVNWLWSNLLGGVKVQVAESEAEDALRILAAEGDDERDGQDVPEAAVCPACGSADTHYFLDRRGSFLTWLLFGFPFIPVVSKRVCADCGRKWKT